MYKMTNAFFKRDIATGYIVSYVEDKQVLYDILYVKSGKVIFGDVCYAGDIRCVRLMIDLGADNWNAGLYGACYGGHRQLVDLMIERGANDWDHGLSGACQSGQKDLIDMMIKRGATYCETCNSKKHPQFQK